MGLVDLIGKVREYNGEIHLVPEIIFKVKDPNRKVWITLTRVYTDLKSTGKF